MVDISAAVIHEAGGSFSIENLVLDEPRPDEVLVKVTAVGMCHTDIYVAGLAQGDTVLGHEGVGVVERVGSSVRGFAPGDRVIMSYDSCGRCANCLNGRPAYCEQSGRLNFGGLRDDGSKTIHTHDGADVAGSFFGQSSFATYALAFEHNLVKVPDSVDDELFTILGPLGCGIQTGAGAILNTFNPKAGSTIVVGGAGAVGLSAVLGARASGASRIVVIDVVQSRLDLALSLGATAVINGTDEDVVDQITALTNGGSEYAIDTTGNIHVIRNIVAGSRMGGKVGLIGAGRPGARLDLDYGSIFARGITVQGIIMGDSVPKTMIPRLIDLHLQGDFPFDKLVKLYPFGDIQSAAADSESGVTIKPVLVV